jgi:hypothetical protein
VEDDEILGGKSVLICSDMIQLYELCIPLASDEREGLLRVVILDPSIAIGVTIMHVGLEVNEV